MIQFSSQYFCLRWIQRGQVRWCWRPTVWRCRLRSRRGGAGAHCCTPNPKLSRCVRTLLHAASTGLQHKKHKSGTMTRSENLQIQTKTHDAVTVGVVGVDVGVGGVPALDSPVNPSTETLLPCAAHYHAQHSPSGSNSDELLKRLVDLTLKLKHFFLICFVFTCEPWKCRSVPHLKQHSCGQTI